MYRPKQMHLHGCPRDPCCSLYFTRIHLLHEMKQKYCPLSLRQDSENTPDCFDLFRCCSPFFRRNALIRNPLARGIQIHARRLRSLPELKSAVSTKVSNQIDCDLHEPRLNATGAPKSATSLIISQEANLRHCLCSGSVPLWGQSEAKDPRPTKSLFTVTTSYLS